MKSMKSILVPLAALLFAIASLQGGETPKTVRLKIEGMTCGGCSAKIGKAVGSVGGAALRTLNLQEGYADVEFASAATTTDAVVMSIAEAGYHASPMSEGYPSPSQKSGNGPAPNAKLDDIRAQLAKAKNGLMMDGKYSCCISPSCDFCAMAMNGCPCGDNLAKGKPVCGECKGGWTAGFGIMPDIDPKDVKALPDADLKKMYKSRSELIKQSKPAGGKKE